MATITVFGGSNNKQVVQVLDDQGAALDLSSATRFVAECFAVNDSTNNLLLDTDTTSGVITGNSDGELTFDLSGTTVKEDEYTVRLTYYTASETNGIILSHECCDPHLFLKICDDYTAA